MYVPKSAETTTTEATTTTTQTTTMLTTTTATTETSAGPTTPAATTENTTITTITTTTTTITDIPVNTTTDAVATTTAATTTVTETTTTTTATTVTTTLPVTTTLSETSAITTTEVMTTTATTILTTLTTTTVATTTTTVTTTPIVLTSPATTSTIASTTSTAEQTTTDTTVTTTATTTTKTEVTTTLTTITTATTTATTAPDTNWYFSGKDQSAKIKWELTVDAASGEAVLHYYSLENDVIFTEKDGKNIGNELSYEITANTEFDLDFITSLKIEITNILTLNDYCLSNAYYPALMQKLDCAEMDESVKTIGKDIFAHSPLKHLIITDQLESINNLAFNNANALEEIDLRSSMNGELYRIADSMPLFALKKAGEAQKKAYDDLVSCLKGITYFGKSVYDANFSGNQFVSGKGTSGIWTNGNYNTLTICETNEASAAAQAKTAMGSAYLHADGVSSEIKNAVTLGSEFIQFGFVSDKMPDSVANKVEMKDSYQRFLKDKKAKNFYKVLVNMTNNAASKKEENKQEITKQQDAINQAKKDAGDDGKSNNLVKAQTGIITDSANLNVALAQIQSVSSSNKGKDLSVGVSSDDLTGQNLDGAAGDSKKEKTKKQKEMLKSSSNFMSNIANLGDKAVSYAFLEEYFANMFSCYTTNKEGNDQEKTLANIPLCPENNVYFGKEWEYLTWGGDPDSAVTKTMLTIYGIRFALNTIYAFTSGEVQSIANAIALAIAGWTGFGVPIVQAIVTVVLALAESGIDLSELSEGKEVPLYKSSSTWRCSISGAIKYGGTKVANTVIDGASDFLSDLASENIDNLSENATNYVNNTIDQTVSDMKDVLGSSLTSDILQNVSEDIDKLPPNVVENSVTSAIDNLTKTVTSKTDSTIVKEAEKIALAELKKNAVKSDLVQKLNTKVNSVISSAQQVSDLYANVQKEINKAIDEFVESKLKEPIEEFINEKGEKLKKTVDDGIDKAGNKLKDGAKDKIESALSDFNGGSSSKNPSVDRVLESFEESKPKNQAASQEPLHMPEQKPMQREQENMRQSDLVNVAQETRTVAAAAQSREKKSMLSGLFGSREGKSRQEHGSNLMAQLRGVQNGNGKAEPRLQQPVQPLVQASAAQRIQTNGQKNAPYGGTVLILHEEPEEKGFLICQLGKLPIDPEGSRIGRLHGATSQRITIFFDSSHVSSYHALLAYDFERNCFTVTDFSSTGVKHNGVRIPKETPIVLKDQDTLVFGDVACRVQLEQSGKQV